MRYKIRTLHSIKICCHFLKQVSLIKLLHADVSSQQSTTFLPLQSGCCENSLFSCLGIPTPEPANFTRDIDRLQLERSSFQVGLLDNSPYRSITIGATRDRQRWAQGFLAGLLWQKTVTDSYTSIFRSLPTFFFW